MPATHEKDRQIAENRAWLVGVARSLVGTTADAEDTAHNALLRALEHPPREGLFMRSWHARVLRHVGLNTLRANRRRGHREERYATGEASESDAPDLEFLQRELLDRLSAAFGKLKATHRTVLELHYHQALPLQAVAERLGISKTTAHEQVQRALAELRSELDERYQDKLRWRVLSAGLPPYVSTSKSSVPRGFQALQLTLLAVGIAAVIFWFVRAPDSSARVVRSGESGIAAHTTENSSHKFRAHTERAEQAISLMQPCEVKGRVLDAASARAIKGAEISLSAEVEGRRYAVAQSADDGTFNVRATAKDALQLTVLTRGYLPYTRSIPGPCNQMFVVSLTPGGTNLRGVVYDALGGRVAGATVTARAEFLGATVSTESAADGGYKLPLGPGLFEVRASHESYAGVSLVVHVDHQKGPDLVRDFRLTLPGTIRGRVVAQATSLPVPGVDVLLQLPFAESSFGPPSLAQAITDGLGNFEIRSLPPGDYLASLSGAGWGAPSPTSVSLALGQTTTIQLLATKGYAISGQIANWDGKPRASTHVGLSEPWASGVLKRALQLSTVAPDGTFRFEGVAIGSYQVRVDDGLSLPTDVEVTGTDVGGVSVVIAAGTRVAGRIQPAQVGTVELAASWLQTGYVLTRFSNASRIVAANAEGLFVFDDVAPGSYQIRALSTAGVRGELPISVGRNPIDGLKVQLGLDSVLNGRVLTEAGTPMPHVQVILSGRNEPHYGVDYDGTTSDDQGRYRLLGLKPDEYNVSLIKQEAYEELMLAPGQKDTLTIKQGSNQRDLRVRVSDKEITGDVVDGAGAVVSDVDVVAVGEGFNQLAVTRSDERGEFVVRGVDDARWFLATDRRGATGRAAADVKRIRITLGTAAAVLGTLRTGDGKPQQHFQAFLAAPAGFAYGDTDPRSQSKRVYSEAGRVEFTNLFPDRYSLVLASSTGVASAIFDLQNAERQAQVLTEKPWAKLSGTLTRCDGKSTEGVIVYSALDKVDGVPGEFFGTFRALGTRTALSNASGQFSMEYLPPGSYRLSFVRIPPRPEGPDTVGKDCSDKSEPQLQFELGAGETRDFGTLFLK